LELKSGVVILNHSTASMGNIKTTIGNQNLNFNEHENMEQKSKRNQITATCIDTSNDYTVQSEADCNMKQQMPTKW
jgi:hypothetical protein